MRNTGFWVLACVLVGCSTGAAGQKDSMRVSNLVLGGQETKHHVPVLTPVAEPNPDAAAPEPRVDMLAVTEKILARADKMGFEKLSRPEQNVAAVWGLEADVNSGGFDQYFFNASGDLASSAPAALREIGAPGAATIVEEAVSAFGTDGPAADQEDRQQQVERLTPETKTKWVALNQKFNAYADDIADLLQTYVKQNREAFL